MIKRLNLQEGSWPLCLLEFNQALLQLEPGQGLEIRVRDAEIGHQMEWLAERAGGVRCSTVGQARARRIRIFREGVTPSQTPWTTKRAGRHRRSPTGFSAGKERV